MSVCVWVCVRLCGHCPSNPCRPQLCPVGMCPGTFEFYSQSMTNCFVLTLSLPARVISLVPNGLSAHVCVCLVALTICLSPLDHSVPSLSLSVICCPCVSLYVPKLFTPLCNIDGGSVAANRSSLCRAQWTECITRSVPCLCHKSVVRVRLRKA